MNTKIHHENYVYFLNESEDLLRTIETELLHLRQQRTQAKVYSLMRATHTLKGAAAIVEQKTIQNLSHYLENVFQALLDPTVEIDGELETLLFQGYECMRLALAAEIRGDTYNLEDIQNRGADIFSQIQQKLGDALARENTIPSSAELGFDIVKSVFEVGVKEKLETLKNAWASGDRQQIITTFPAAAEVFVGLGESLNLSGFQAIAQATLEALKTHPEQALIIAGLALQDFQEGYEAVMAGDRQSGGNPSPQLLEVVGELGDKLSPQVKAGAKSASASRPEIAAIAPPPPVNIPANIPVDIPANIPANIPVKPAANLPDFNLEDAALVEVFGSLEIPEEVISEYLSPPREEIVLRELEELVVGEPDRTVPEKSEPMLWRDANATDLFPEPVTFEPSRNSQTLRVDLEQLEHQNYLAGELLINQNQLALQGEQVEETVQKLLGWLQKHRQTLGQLRKFLAQDQSYRTGEIGNAPYRTGEIDKSYSETAELLRASQEPPSAALKEMLEVALEETVQLEQGTADLSLFSENAQQFVDQEQRLLKQMREGMQEMRMMPVGNVLQRLALITQRLTQDYNKPVEIKLRGLGVLIDKAIAESLYESLLHLIRNAFAHGIEPGSVRRQYQKPEVGTIEVNAYNQGNRTIIEVTDDGAGLDVDRIFRTALAQNLLTPEQVEHLKQLPKPESHLLDILCSPGMSTKDDINDLAGRGIGLDVVRSQLQQIRGHLSLQSQRHRGTTFSLQIRGALMSARLLSCRSGDRIYTFVAQDIVQTLMPFGSEIKKVGEQKILPWHDGTKEISVPIYQLEKLFDYGAGLSLTLRETITPLLTPRQGRIPILLLAKGEGFVGLEVDQVIEEQELVIKPIPEAIPAPDYIYGCTVLADGSMTLVVDGVALIDYGTGKRGIEAIGNITNITNAANTAKIANTANPDLPEIPPTPPLAALGGTPKTTILIVDDSITERQKLSLILKKRGYQVQQAKDGVEALEQLQKNPAIPLIICDLEMPRMTGFEFLSVTRQQPNFAKIPVIMLTSRSSPQYQQIARSLGATAYFTKPYLDYQLLSKVEEILITANSKWSKP